MNLADLASPPPTPAPSPGPHPPPAPPSPAPPPAPSSAVDAELADLRRRVNRLDPDRRGRLLALLLADTPSLSLAPLLPLIAPRLQRDFLAQLPPELALHVLSFIDEPHTLLRAAAVSKQWRHLVLDDDHTWKRLCRTSGFHTPHLSLRELQSALPPLAATTTRRRHQQPPHLSSATPIPRVVHPPEPDRPPPPPPPFSYRSHYRYAFETCRNWHRGPGRLLSTQMSADAGAVTSLAFDGEWIAVGMETSQVHVFEAHAGGYVRTLDGHETGVWCLALVSRGGGPRTTTTSSGGSRRPRGAGGRGDARRARRGEGEGGPTESADFGSDPDSRGSDPEPVTTTPGASSPDQEDEDDDPASGGMGLGAGGPTRDSVSQGSACATARGWGQDAAVLVSGGCDRTVRVWDVSTG